MADAWKEFAEFKKAELDTGKRTAADGFGTREFLKNDYLVPHGVGRARHLRQLEGGGALPGLLRRRGRRASSTPQQAATRCGSRPVSCRR